MNLWNDADWSEKLIFSISTIIVIILGFILYNAYEHSNSATFILYKDEYTCTNSHQHIYTTTMLVGKVMIPQVHSDTICDNYGRIK